MKKLLSITVKGNNKTWAFDFDGDDEFLKEWRDDGLEVNEIIAEIRQDPCDLCVDITPDQDYHIETYWKNHNAETFRPTFCPECGRKIEND